MVNHFYLLFSSPSKADLIFSSVCSNTAQFSDNHLPFFASFWEPFLWYSLRQTSRHEPKYEALPKQVMFRWSHLHGLVLPLVSKVGLSTNSDCLPPSTSNACTDYIWHLLYDKPRASPTTHTLKPIFVFQVRFLHPIHGLSEANLSIPMILASRSSQFTAENYLPPWN